MLYPEFPSERFLDLPAIERFAPGVSDLLDYDQPVSETVLGHKAGAMVAAFDFVGPSHDAAEDDELDLAEEQLLGAFADLGSGWVVHLDLARFRTASYPCQSAATDPAFGLVEAARRKTFETQPGYRSQTTLWLTLFGSPNDSSTERTEQRLEGFELSLDAFRSKVGAATTLRRLELDEMVSRVHAALRVQAPRPITTHPDAFLDTLIAPSIERLPSGVLRLGAQYAVPLRFTALPKRLRSGVMLPLATSRLPYRLTTRFVMLSNWHAEQAIDRIRRRRETSQFSWRSLFHTITQGKGKARSTRDHEVKEGFAPNESVQRTKILEANQALESSYSSEPFVYFTTSLLVAGSSETEAMQHADQALSILRASRLDADIDRYNEVQAYLGAAPGNAWCNLRKSFQPLRAALALQSLTSTWPGHDDAPHLRLCGQGPLAIVRGTGGEAFRLNLHPAGDDLADLGHTLVIGPSGSGKSVLLNFLAASARRYKSSRVVSLDVDRSQMVHCLAAEGAFYDLRDDHLSFAPLFQLRENTYQARAMTLAWLMTLWDATHKEPLGDDDAEHLADAVEEVMALDSELHSIEILAAKAQSPKLRRLFARYTASGEHARLFAGHENQLESADYTVIELRGLLGLRPEAKTPAFAHLLQLVSSMLDGRPSWVLIDEGSHVLADSILASGIHDWLITLRKRNAAVVFATQSLGHLANPTLRQIMSESCPTRIFLPNPAAASNAVVRESYAATGLTERQIDRIASATPKKHYLFLQPGNERLIDLDLSPTELVILGASSPQAIEEVMTHRDAHPDRWLSRWLTSQSVRTEPSANNSSKEPIS